MTTLNTNDGIGDSHNFCYEWTSSLINGKSQTRVIKVLKIGVAECSRVRHRYAWEKIQMRTIKRAQLHAGEETKQIGS